MSECTNDPVNTTITVLTAVLPTLWALLNEYLAWKKRKGESEVACVGDCVRTLLRRRQSVDVEYVLPTRVTT